MSAIDRYLDLYATHVEELGDFQVEQGEYEELFAQVADRFPSRRKLPYRITVHNDIPLAMGIGSSTALIASAVAMFRALLGGVFDRSVIFGLTRSIEARATGASGIDAVGCIFGGTHYYLPRSADRVADVITLCDHLPTECHLTSSGKTHDASCSEVMSRGGEAHMARITNAMLHPSVTVEELHTLVSDAHDMLQREGLSTSGIDSMCAMMPGAKLTGQGRGGMVLSMCPCSASSRRHAVVCGLSLQSDIYTTIPHELVCLTSLLTLPENSTGTARVPSNLALVKYWGKDDKQIAHNMSISLTLPHLFTTTSVHVVPKNATRSVVDEKVDAFVGRMLQEVVPEECALSVVTHNNFPGSCGIASSASGYAALVSAIADAANGQFADVASRAYWLQQWSRLGSGSAIRSLYNGLVSWQNANANEHAIHPSLSSLEHMVIGFDTRPKDVSSSEGHALAPSSRFHSIRAATADIHTMDLIRAFAAGDFDTVRIVSESEAMTMHMVMATSTPPIQYLTPEAIDFVAKYVSFRNERRLKAFYSIDAGSNIHALFLPCARQSVTSFVHQHKNMFTLVRGHFAYRYSIVVLSGKRFSGKSTLSAHLLQRHGKEAVQLVSISDAIKREYCEQHGIAKGTLSDRSEKEMHRKRMIDYRDKRVEQEGAHYWCQLAWGSIHPFPKTVLISDARRPEDVEFFRHSSKCTTVRIVCSDEVRQERGWEYDPSIDDSASETGLDKHTFDHTIGYPHLSLFHEFENKVQEFPCKPVHDGTSGDSHASEMALSRVHDLESTRPLLCSGGRVTRA